MTSLTRRGFVGLLGAAGLCANGVVTAASDRRHFPVAFFEKPLQFLGYRELADVLGEIGFDGIEATIRKGGHIEPERAGDELPGCVEDLRAGGQRILVMATSINRVDQPGAELTLRTAAKLGVKQYRLNGLSYASGKPILAQLDNYRAQLKELAALNRELGITGVYQNHAGSKNVGGPIWDLDYLLRGIDPNHLGIAYDIRHAMVEGASAWPVSLSMIRPRVRCIYVKDFVFDGAKPKNVPMGEGIVGSKFYQEIKGWNARPPISIHAPYLRGINSRNLKEALRRLKKDFDWLKSQLA